MKLTVTIIGLAVFCTALVGSLPLPEEGLQSEALDRMIMVESDNEAALRSKRTIGILRALFPEVSKMIENKVNMIVSEVIRVLGPVVLRGVLGNGGLGGGTVTRNGGGTSGSGTTVTVASPFADDDNDDNKDDDDGSFNSMSSNGSRISISLPTFPPDEDEDADTADTIPATSATALDDPTTEGATTLADATTTTEPSTVNNSDVNQEAENQVNEVGAESQNNEVRVQFADEANEAEPAELAPLDDIDTGDDENRNKRFLNFGFGGSGGAGGGSGAGSGNFLFDIIRQAADGAARAAGTVYRVVAGTQSLGLGLSATRDVGPAAPAAAAPAAPATPSTPAPAPGAGSLPPLVAGSGSGGSAQQGNSSASSGRTDGAQEAVPGPITRLFVIANRGISNLIQDLILRLAATSERIVNFKARLITSII